MKPLIKRSFWFLCVLSPYPKLLTSTKYVIFLKTNITVALSLPAIHSSPTLGLCRFILVLVDHKKKNQPICTVSSRIVNSNSGLNLSSTWVSLFHFDGYGDLWCYWTTISTIRLYCCCSTLSCFYLSIKWYRAK